MRRWAALLLRSPCGRNAIRQSKLKPICAPVGGEFKETLIEHRFKEKSSPPMQVADRYLWPIARQRYGREKQPYDALREAERLIECKLQPAEIEARGSKFSCFHPVHRYLWGQKRQRPRFLNLSLWRWPHCGDPRDCARSNGGAPRNQRPRLKPRTATAWTSCGFYGTAANRQRSAAST